jgi:hypothetical protein
MRSPFDRGWHTAVVVASGPSFDQAQADTIEAARAAGAVRCIVVNECFRLIPKADALYAADAAWYSLRIADVRATFRGELWTQHEGQLRVDGGKREQWIDVAGRWGIKIIRSEPGAGMHPADNCVYRGGNSGHQAIGLATLFGATRIVLCGFDLQGGHWHGQHPLPLSNGNPASWREKFEPLARDLAAAGIDCVNASAATALTCFPRAKLAEALGV